jgi:uncharacterized RDD family membrane protein YckC
MTDLVVETPEGLTLRYEIAGAGSRSAAALIDVTIWGLATLTLLFFFQVVLGGLGGLAIWVAAGTILSLVTYQVAFAILGRGVTPGKRLLGLLVVDEDGLPATGLQHLLRGLFWPFEAILFVPVPLGVVVMAATPRHQRLGDHVAGTLVLRAPERRSVGEPLRRSRWSELPNQRLGLVPALAARFDGEDVAFLRDALGRVDVEPDARARLLIRAARHYAGRLDHELPPRLGSSEARALLSELYLFLREMRARG